MTVALNYFWPLWIGAASLTCLSVVLAAWTAPSDAASLTLIGQVFLAVLTAGLLGAAISVAFPSVVAVPLATALTWVWTSLFYSLYNPTLNFMSPVLDCCTQDQQPAVGVSAARFSVMLAALAGLSLIFISRSWSRVPRRVVALALASAILLAGVVGYGVLRGTEVNLTAGELGEVSPRTTPLQCEPVRDVNVCVWPEGEQNARKIGLVAAKLNGLLAEWGLPRIEAIAQGGLRDGAVNINQSVMLDGDNHIVSMIARGYIAKAGGCRYGEWQPGDIDRWIARFTMAGGASAKAMAEDWGPNAAAATQRFLDAGPVSAGNAFRASLDDLKCEGSPS